MCINKLKRGIAFGLATIQLLVCSMVVHAEPSVSAPSAVLMEASTGEVIYEKNASEQRSPASITKIMTLLLAFEQMDLGKIALSDEVIVSEHASSMGGSQVYLAEGEVQTLETMLKCIVVSSGNDASVAVAEHIAGSEEAFVEMMNEKAVKIGLAGTHFEDCCGLTDSGNHYSTALDIAMMSRELITKYPEIKRFATIWMEDITHVTRQGSSTFTLSSTNKLLKQYQYTTGLKTGFTSKAMFCVSATAAKDGMEMIAVIMGASNGKDRFADARVLLNYGFSICRLYTDCNEESIAPIPVKGGIKDEVSVRYGGEFRYLDLEGNSLENVEKKLELPEQIPAPVVAGQKAGEAVYYLNGIKIGQVPVYFGEDIKAASFGDYFYRAVGFFLL